MYISQSSYPDLVVFQSSVHFLDVGKHHFRIQPARADHLVHVISGDKVGDTCQPPTVEHVIAKVRDSINFILIHLFRQHEWYMIHINIHTGIPQNINFSYILWFISGNDWIVVELGTLCILTLQSGMQVRSCVSCSLCLISRNQRPGISYYKYRKFLLTSPGGRNDEWVHRMRGHWTRSW